MHKDSNKFCTIVVVMAQKRACLTSKKVRQACLLLWIEVGVKFQ